MIFLVLSGRVESIDGVDGFWRLYRRILAWKIMTASDRLDALKRGGPGIRKSSRNGVVVGDSDGGIAARQPTSFPMTSTCSNPTCSPRTFWRSAEKSPSG